MKSSAPLLAFALLLSLRTAPARADETKLLTTETTRQAILDLWDDEPTSPSDANAPTPPSNDFLPSDTEAAPPGALPKQGLSPKTTIYPRTMMRSGPPMERKTALDEAYEGVIDDTIGLVLHPDCPHLTRDCGCLPPSWPHRSGVFGEYLFLRPRSRDVSYAMPVALDSVVPTPGAIVPVGTIGTNDPNYSSGFRVGVNRAIDQFASIRGTYTYYQNSERDSITAAPDTELHSLVSHPGIIQPNLPFTTAASSSSVNFQMADVELRKLLAYSPYYALNYSVGARYVHLSQDFGTNLTGLRDAADNVSADSNFDGGGIRFGLDGEHYARRTGLMAYWRTGASFVGGQFRANYRETFGFDPLVIQSHWNGGRLVSILDAELGVGWTSKTQRMRLRAGYLVSGWFNTVTPGDYISATQHNNYGNLSKSFSFDGLTASVEYRY